MAISDLGLPQIFSPPPPGDLFWYQAHGLLLYFAFGWLYPAGAFAVKYARYHVRFRRWFQCHWIVQSIAVFATVSAITVSLRCFTDTGKSPHRFIGFSLTVFVVLQPVVALFRPDRECGWRRCWENFHWFLGTATVILGWVNVYKGLSMYAKVWPDCGNGYLWTFLFSVQITIIGFGFLYFDRCHLERPERPDDPCMVQVPLLTKAEKRMTGNQFLTKV